jgi:pimeloyl-ACP methyl ester carboxylesterase
MVSTVRSPARLIGTKVPEAATGVVLVLHGGAGREQATRVSPLQPSVVRMIPIAARIATESAADVAVFRLTNAYRGWNERQTPVDDANWALDELAARCGACPVSLVGHSLGGRAALLAGTHAAVVSVTALNPYLYSRDAHANLAGRQVAVVHGTADRIAPFATAAGVAEGLARSTHVDFVRVDGGNHAMLTRRRAFEEAAAAFAIRALGPDPMTAAAGDLSPGLRRHTV